MVYVCMCVFVRVCVRVITLQVGHGFVLWSGQCVCLTNNAYTHTHNTHTLTHKHTHTRLKI